MKLVFYFLFFSYINTFASGSIRSKCINYDSTYFPEDLNKKYTENIYEVLKGSKSKGVEYDIQEDFIRFKNKDIGMPINSLDGFICKDKCIQSDILTDFFCYNKTGNSVRCANYLQDQYGRDCDIDNKYTYGYFGNDVWCKIKDENNVWSFTHPIIYPRKSTKETRIVSCATNIVVDINHPTVGITNKIVTDIKHPNKVTVGKVLTKPSIKFLTRLPDTTINNTTSMANASITKNILIIFAVIFVLLLALVIFIIIRNKKRSVY